MRRSSINIMSLAGVILALGDMVDSACVLIENAHKKIEEAERDGTSPASPERGQDLRRRKVERKELVIGAARELGPSMFGALLVLTIAFLPVFSLQGEEGLFRPLALSKTFSMAFASIFAITLVPALMVTFLTGKITPEAKNPINRLCIAAYRPLLRVCLEGRYAVIALVLVIMGATIYPLFEAATHYTWEWVDVFALAIIPAATIELAKWIRGLWSARKQKRAAGIGLKVPGKLAHGL